MEAIDTTTGYVMQQGSKERQTVSIRRLSKHQCAIDAPEKPRYEAVGSRLHAIVR
jgi:hypothetical protein